jgi:hypothetical protein
VATVVFATLAWLVFIPWDLSRALAQGDAGDLFGSDTVRLRYVAALGVVAMFCGVLAWWDRSGVTARGIAAVATIAVWYAFRANAADTVSTNDWVGALLDVIVAPTAAAAAVGSWLGLRAGRRRQSTTPT